MANQYRQPAPKNGQGGTVGKNQKQAPSPNPGVGAIPKGGPSVVAGQPQLTTKK